MLHLNEYTLDCNKVLTVIEHLEGRARTWALPISQFKRPDLLSDWELFLEQFTRAFQDRHFRERLVHKLQALKQTISVFNYVINFEALCNRVNWPLNVWADQFYQGLKEPIKDAITYSPVDLSDYDELKEQAQQMNQWIMRCNAEASPQAAPSYTSNCVSATSASASSYSSNCVPAVYTPVSSRPAVASAACASVFRPSASHPPYKAFFSPHDPLTDEQKAYWRLHDLCLYCDKSEHIVSECSIWSTAQTLTAMYSDYYSEISVTSESVSSEVIILEFYPLTLSVSNFILERKHLIVQRVLRWRNVQMMMNSEVTVNFVNISWLLSFVWKSVQKLSLEICALDERTIVFKNKSKVYTFNITISQLPVTKLSVITASCVNYNVILETSWLYAVNLDIDWKLWTLTLWITQELHWDFIEELLEASVPLIDHALKALIDDYLKLNHVLVAISEKSPVNDHSELTQALVKFILKSSVSDHSEDT